MSTARLPQGTSQVSRPVIETSVLIVGAGPAGLSLALDLGWRGIDCLLIDQQPSADVVLPRASGLSSRTMEFFRRWGIVEDVARAGFPQDYALDIVYCTSLAGHELAREPYAPLGGREAPDFTPQDRHRCPQKLLDPVLEKALARFPSVTLMRSLRLASFFDDGQGVRAFVDRLPGGKRHQFTGENIDRVFIGERAEPPQSGVETLEIRAKYMVACDGVDSGIRNALEIPLEGTPVLNYTMSLLVDAEHLQDKHKMGAAERYMMIGPEGVWGNLTVVDGHTEWRLSLSGSAQKLDLANLDTDALVRRCFGDDTIPFKVRAMSPWRRREVVSSKVRAGRVFIAGDAAHAMSPTGGFGMNTCIGDSVDLGWKLEAVLKGWGGEALLDTYECERKPVMTRFVKAAADLFKPWMLKLDYSAVLDETPEGEAARRHVGATLKDAMLAEWEIAGTSMGYRYDRSPIVIGDGTEPVPDEPMVYIQNARPGSRAPHAWLDDGRSTLDLFGEGFTLLSFAGDAPSTQALERAASERGMPLSVVQLDRPDIAALYERRFVLVRPDGHVAWRGDALDAPDELLDTVRGARCVAQAQAAA